MSYDNRARYFALQKGLPSIDAGVQCLMLTLEDLDKVIKIANLEGALYGTQSETHSVEVGNAEYITKTCEGISVTRALDHKATWDERQSMEKELIHKLIDRIYDV